MSLITSLTNLYLKFNRKMLFGAESTKKHREMEDQTRYMQSLGEPRDEYERAYLKYKCHSYYHFSNPVRVLYNCAGIVMVPVFAVLFAVKSRKKDFRPFAPEGVILTVSPTMGYKDILPPQIERDYGPVREVKPLTVSERCMDREAWRRFGECFKRYWHHPYFCLEALLRIAGSCELMYRYHPKAVAGYGLERQYIAPILYEYSNDKNVDTVSFMHGIFVYSIDKAYLTFTRYYVWEPYYVDMFYRLRAREGSLEVYKPKKFEPKVKPRPEGVPYDYFLTYYFTSESRDRMERIKQCTDLLESRGLRCKLRPHPRFTDTELLAEVFKGYMIEDKTWTLEQSMECSEYIGAYNSTVLTEAYYSDKKVLIDNYVDPAKFQNMIDRGYIMLSRPHTLMTDLIKEYCGVDLIGGTK